jgi:hypothetical protein
MSRRWQAFLLVMASLGCLAMLPLGALGAIVSPMVFDNPYNLQNPFAWFAFLLMVGLWVVCIIAPYAAWVAFIKGRQSLQWTAIGAPFAWCAVMSLALLLVPR